LTRGRAGIGAVGLGLACVLIAACSSAAARTEPQSAPSPNRATSTTRSTTTTTVAATTTTTVPVVFHRAVSPPRPLRVLVVGDSVGVSFAAGLQAWAAQTGGAVVRDDSRAWCSLGRYLPRNVYGPQNASAGCDDWGTRWASDVQSFDPDVVFVMFTIWEVVPRKMVGATDYTRPGNPAYDAWQLSEYRAAADVLSARGAPVVWFDIACENDARIKRGEPLWWVNRRTLPALARSRPSVRLVDLDGLLCNGAHLVHDFGGVPDIRPDGAHYSVAGAQALAGWAMPIVLGTRPPPPYAPN
jgi:hypothetical protein